MHWTRTVELIRARKLEIARLDPHGGMPIRPPAGATAEAIAAVERRMGMPLPPSYRELLATHDGWPSFFSGASLLGTRALRHGTFVDLARLVLEDGALGLAADGAPSAAVVPFGIDANAETVFAWSPAAPTAGGEVEIVVWMNEVAVCVPTFPSFLELVLDMLDADLDERRRAGRGPSSLAATRETTTPHRAEAPAPAKRVRAA